MKEITYLKSQIDNLKKELNIKEKEIKDNPSFTYEKLKKENEQNIEEKEKLKNELNFLISVIIKIKIIILQKMKNLKLLLM